MNDPTDRPYRVSEITRLIKATLESGFSGVSIEGEISNYRPASSGHLYFSLKDQDAVIQAVMFRSRASRLTFVPEPGQLVVAKGNVSVYEKRGNYQIICDSLRIAGEGALLAMLDERKRRLAAEGLFDESRKRPLPVFPSRIAVVTSQTGAALRDILQVISRRNAGLDLVVLPTTVQGEGAAETIAQQIRAANRFGLGEVVIVGRGGGSLEDLLPFSEEVVVRAVSESQIPVISAVGHEIDIALSDLAADVRAPTPSAAAELVTAQRDELIGMVRHIIDTMEGTIVGKLERARMLLGQFRPEALERNFRILVQPMLLRLDDAKEELLRALSNSATRAKHRLELATRQLESLSPRGILEKGYAIVTDQATGAAVTNAGSQAVGTRIDIQLTRGRLGAQVEEVDDGEF